MVKGSVCLKVILFQDKLKILVWVHVSLIGKIMAQVICDHGFANKDMFLNQFFCWFWNKFIYD